MVTEDSGNDPLRSMRPMKWPTRLRGRPRIASLLAVGCCLLALTKQAWADDPPQPDAHGENSVAFAPDGKWLVTGGSDGKVRMRDGTSGAVLATLTGHNPDANINAVAVSPDGRTIASASNDLSTRLWDVERRAERSLLQISRQPRGRHRRHCFIAVAFAPDGRTVATGDNGGFLRLWDVASGELRETWVADSKRVNQLLYSPDGGTIASSGDDPDVKLWDARSHALRRPLAQPGKFRPQMAYMPDGATLAVSRDLEIVLWDPSTGVRRDRFEARIGPDFALAFTPDGDYLATGGIGISHLYAVKARADKDDRWSVILTSPETNDCSAIAVSPDGRLVAHCFSKPGMKTPKPSFKLVAIR